MSDVPTNDALRELVIGEVSYETRYTKKFEKRTPYVPPDPRHIRCVIPGVILSVAVRKGMRVKGGEPLLVLEAMKMQNQVVSPREGTIHVLCVSAGDAVTRGQVLLEFE
jgi:biotin carboxyl carrier protein